MSTAAPVLLLDDDHAWALGPLADTRPCFEIRLGAFNLRERLQRTVDPGRLRARVRPHLKALLDETALPPVPSPSLEPGDGSCIVVDGRASGSIEAWREVFQVLDAGPDGLRVDDECGRWVAARLKTSQLPAWIDEDLATTAGCQPVRIHGSSPPRVFERPWEWIGANAELLFADAEHLRREGFSARTIFGVRFEEDSARAEILRQTGTWVSARRAVDPGALLVSDADVLFAPSARVRAGAVIDAEHGPVILCPGVVVHPLAVVTGPAYLGPGTVVNPGAKLREGTSLGAHCKVGGEIEESVVQDLSNKQHDGFLGHAVVGSWVNLGADTNGSDLKNNYGSVRVDLGDGIEDTGLTFVGPHLGDHAKTGIDTMLTTGAVVGVCGNVFGGGFAPRLVPAFGWGGSEGLREYRLDAAIATARVVFSRRQARFTERHEALLRALFDRSAAQRARVFGRPAPGTPPER